MHWYVIPIFQKIAESGNTLYVPGQDDPVVEFVCACNFTIHAAGPKGAPTTALFGASNELFPLPPAWAAKSVEEARAHFEAVVGRAPTAQEVF